MPADATVYLHIDDAYNYVFFDTPEGETPDFCAYSGYLQTIMTEEQKQSCKVYLADSGTQYLILTGTQKATINGVTFSAKDQSKEVRFCVMNNSNVLNVYSCAESDRGASLSEQYGGNISNLVIEKGDSETTVVLGFGNDQTVSGSEVNIACTEQ